MAYFKLILSYSFLLWYVFLGKFLNIFEAEELFFIEIDAKYSRTNISRKASRRPSVELVKRDYFWILEGIHKAYLDIIEDS